MRQERFSPSTNVSNWKGRQDYLKGYPGAAMSDALNGGFAGGGGYVLEDSYEFFAKASYSARMNIQNIPQTHRHLHIDFTNSNQSSYWGGLHCTVMFNQPSSVQPSQPNDGNWDGMDGYYYYKGWSTGDGQNNTGPRSSFLPLTQAYSNNANAFSLQIYNYSDSTAVCKPAKLWAQYNSGNNSSYSVFLESYGFLLASAGTQNGDPSPAITSIQTYDSYANGSGSYQSFNIYGFGGKV